MGKQTPLFAEHQNAQAKIVDFGGWDMPLHYGSQVEEHHGVRQACGIFDVSHMTIVDIEGSEAASFLAKLLANDVDRLVQGQALYTCMLNEKGGIVDDLIAYYREPERYRLVVNASTRDKDMAWIDTASKDFDVSVIEQPEFALLAVQGPTAKQTFAAVAENHNLASLWEKVAALKPFTSCEHNQVFVGRTGYTGEFGYEIMMPAAYVVDTWKAFVGQGARACGLGCRDTLRIEAGLNLYGSDMDESVTPLDCGLDWTVSFERKERDFIGRTALEEQLATGQVQQFRGVALLGRGVIRGGYKVTTSDGAEGLTTSGTFSPTMNRSVGFVRMAPTAQSECIVHIRGREHSAQLCPLPFVRNGTIRVEI